MFPFGFWGWQTTGRMTGRSAIFRVGAGTGSSLFFMDRNDPQSSPSNQSDCYALHFRDIPALKVSIFNLKHDLPDIFTTFQDGVGVGGALDWQNGVDCRDNLPRFELGPDIAHEAR